MTSIEAIAAGCRVICGAWSPFTELAKQIPEAIFPLQDPTPATIADEIQRIANLPGRPEVDLRPYDWNTIAHETLKIFEGVF
jgi:hypothetical protein